MLAQGMRAFFASRPGEIDPTQYFALKGQPKLLHIEFYGIAINCKTKNNI
jgi:hypothetical protein